ncbi:Low-density lipoprotein receptor domain class A containing protein, partial [Aphelenchoides avenae]
FGSLRGSGDFWLGNERLHSLSTARQCGHELLVRMRGAKRGNVFYARYESFQVGDETDNYRLKLGPLVIGGPRFTDLDGLLLARDQHFVAWDTLRRHCDK